MVYRVLTIYGKKVKDFTNEEKAVKFVEGQNKYLKKVYMEKIK